MKRSILGDLTGSGNYCVVNNIITFDWTWLTKQRQRKL